MGKFAEKSTNALESAYDYAYADLHRLILWLVIAFVYALLEIADAIRYSD